MKYLNLTQCLYFLYCYRLINVLYTPRLEKFPRKHWDVTSCTIVTSRKSWGSISIESSKLLIRRFRGLKGKTWSKVKFIRDKCCKVEFIGHDYEFQQNKSSTSAGCFGFWRVHSKRFIHTDRHFFKVIQEVEITTKYEYVKINSENIFFLNTKTNTMNECLGLQEN